MTSEGSRPTVVVADYRPEMEASSPFFRHEIEREAVEKAGGQFVRAASRTGDDLVAATAEADVVLLVGFLRMDRRAIQQLRRCRGIIRYGVGVDAIDVEAATEMGILVGNVPDYCTDEVSDHAVALLLNLARQVSLLQGRVKAGRLSLPMPVIHRLRGRTLGLVGFGRIARMVARKAQAFGLRVVVCDPYLDAGAIAEQGVEPMGLEEVLRTADFVSLHTPLNAGTSHLIGERELAMMKPSAYLINTSRGGVVNEGALLQALKEGRLAGAGLDVVESEPPEPSNPLLELENVILLPHSGATSEESIVDLQHRVADAAVRLIRGERPRSVVNPWVEEREWTPARS